MPLCNHYQLLQVPTTATADEVDAAFMRAINACQQTGFGRFRASVMYRTPTAFSQAHQTLNDPKSRAAYDKWLRDCTKAPFLFYPG